MFRTPVGEFRHPPSGPVRRVPVRRWIPRRAGRAAGPSSAPPRRPGRRRGAAGRAARGREPRCGPPPRGARPDAGVEQRAHLTVAVLGRQREDRPAGFLGGSHHALAQDLLGVAGLPRRGQRVGRGDEPVHGQGGGLPQQRRPVGAQPRAPHPVREQRESDGRPRRGLGEQGVRLAAAPVAAQPREGADEPGDLEA